MNNPGTSKNIRKAGIISAILILILIISYQVFKWYVTPAPPQPDNTSSLSLTREKVSENFYAIGNNWFRKSKTGIYELYVEGDAFERGVITGRLAKEHVQGQEDIFVGQMKEFVPSATYRFFLHKFIAWYNRNLTEHIPKEYLLEIYGVSESLSDRYTEEVGPKYSRILNYHAAHDIGHALQQMNLVGCTSFASWNSYTRDSSMVIGRNLDFNVGDEFAEKKIVTFCNPAEGYNFASVGWGGFCGVLSGMNETGLTVTINAGKSEMPMSSATPISLIAREVLQYASTIEEAHAIVRKRKAFVSESLLIGSAKDGKAAIIEKTPEKTGIYFPRDEQLICSNHFQSDAFRSDSINIKHRFESTSQYRFERMEELLLENHPLTPVKTAAILRDQQGINGKDIGYGNEKALNQLAAHHSVIFQPEKELMWVSANPYQLGEFVCYDLNKIFTKLPGNRKPGEICEDSLNIPEDSFLSSPEYEKFRYFKEISKKIDLLISEGEGQLSSTELQLFSDSNPEMFRTYEYLGDYYFYLEEFSKAQEMYKKALTKEIPNQWDAEQISEKLSSCSN